MYEYDYLNDWDIEVSSEYLGHMKYFPDDKCYRAVHFIRIKRDTVDIELTYGLSLGDSYSYRDEYLNKAYKIKEVPQNWMPIIEKVWQLGKQQHRECGVVIRRKTSHKFTKKEIFYVLADTLSVLDYISWEEYREMVYGNNGSVMGFCWYIEWQEKARRLKRLLPEEVRDEVMKSIE